MLRSILAAGLMMLAAIPARAAETLTVLTYESFTAEWGPGPAIEKAFEAQCGCDLKWVAVGDGVAILNRLKLEGDSPSADIALGLDNNLIAEARATGLFAPHGQKLDGLTLPLPWTDDTFLPYDYAHFAVIYDTEKMPVPPKSLDELVRGDPDSKIVIEDPRTSTPGLGLLIWIKAVYGDKAGDVWKIFKHRVLTVTPGWSEAYALFTKGEAPMVLSYTTSPAYHEIAEKSDALSGDRLPRGASDPGGGRGQAREGGQSGARRQVPRLHADARFPGSDPDRQLDAARRPHQHTVAGGIRQARETGEDARHLARRGRRQPARLDGRVARRDGAVKVARRHVGATGGRPSGRPCRVASGATAGRPYGRARVSAPADILSDGRGIVPQRRLLIGGIVLLALGLLTGAALVALVTAGIEGRGGTTGYIAGVTLFTLLQASLCALLSVGLAVPVALALASRPEFPGRRLLLRLFAVPMALPVLVGVIGILGIYGQAGVLNRMLQWSGAGSLPPIYGLAGILIAHVFYNLPLATLLLLARLEETTPETWRIAVSLGLEPRSVFRFIDLPALREALPRVLGLVFMLAVASFTIVLTLGGGPGATTLEVAIYQALRFDFDPALAAQLAMLQIVISGAVVLILGRYAEVLGVEPELGRGSLRPRVKDFLQLRCDWSCRTLCARPTARGFVGRPDTGARQSAWRATVL